MTCDCFINSFIHISVSLTSSRIHKFKSEDSQEVREIHHSEGSGAQGKEVLTVNEQDRHLLIEVTACSDTDFYLSYLDNCLPPVFQSYFQ